MTPTYVFVHGSFSNSFIWTAVQRELALLGHRSLAIDLPGHGFEANFPLPYQAPQDLAALALAPGALVGVTLHDNVDRVVEIVRPAKENGPVILVGHSRGGITLTAAGNAVPDLIDRIVYISAWCPVDLTPAEYLKGPEWAETNAVKGGYPDPIGNPAELGVIRQNFRTADPATLKFFGAEFLADGTDAELMVFLNLLEPDENLDVGTADDQAQAETWGRIPRTFIRLTRDVAIPLAAQDRFIREADALTPDNPFDVHSIESSHLKFLVDGKAAAGILASLPPGPPGAGG